MLMSFLGLLNSKLWSFFFSLKFLLYRIKLNILIFFLGLFCGNFIFFWDFGHVLYSFNLCFSESVRLLPILQYPGSFTNLQFCLIRSKVKLIYHTYVHGSIEHQNSYLGPQSIQVQLIFGQLAVSLLNFFWARFVSLMCFH